MDLVLLTVVVRLAIGPGRRGRRVLPDARGGRSPCSSPTSSTATSRSRGSSTTSRDTSKPAGRPSTSSGARRRCTRRWARCPSARPNKEIRLTRGRLVLLGVASLTAQIVRTIQLLRGENNDLWVITVSTTILFVLVVIRMAGLVHKLELSFGREKALRTAGAVARHRDEPGEHLQRGHAGREPADEPGSGAPPRPARRRPAIATRSWPPRTTATACVGCRDRASPPANSTTCSRTAPTMHEDVPQIAELFDFPAATSFRAHGAALPARRAGRAARRRQRRQAAPRRRATRSKRCRPRSPSRSRARRSPRTCCGSRARRASRRSSRTPRDVVMVVDADSTIRYMSPSVERVLGYDARRARRHEA